MREKNNVHCTNLKRLLPARHLRASCLQRRGDNGFVQGVKKLKQCLRDCQRLFVSAWRRIWQIGSRVQRLGPCYPAIFDKQDEYDLPPEWCQLDSGQQMPKTTSPVHMVSLFMHLNIRSLHSRLQRRWSLAN